MYGQGTYIRPSRVCGSKIKETTTTTKTVVVLMASTAMDASFPFFLLPIFTIRDNSGYATHLLLN